MANLDKVLKGLECCSDMITVGGKHCYEQKCPYASMFDTCREQLAVDAIELLKSQQTEITEKDETIAELERCSVAQIAEQQKEIERLKEMNRELVRLNGMNV